MTLPTKLSMIWVLLFPFAAIAGDAAARTPRSLPISKVWPRSAPDTRDLTPPALLRAGRNSSFLPPPFSNKIDLNRCSLQQLQDLPGVGPALGASLMAGRPYRTIGDVARIGIPFNTIEQIAPIIELRP